ncbi:unnamed protein product, partial [marine sediment metagenome]
NIERAITLSMENTVPECRDTDSLLQILEAFFITAIWSSESGSAGWRKQSFVSISGPKYLENPSPDSDFLGIIKSPTFIEASKPPIDPAKTTLSQGVQASER